MILDILKAVEGRVYEFNFETEGFLDLYADRDVKVLSLLKTYGDYYVDKGLVFVRFRAEIQLEVKCDKCLKALPYQNSAHGEMVFSKEPEAGEYPYSGFEIDLSSAVREALSLALPSAFLCKEDCKGLCPICGKDKNVNECSCEDKRKAAANPFAVLQNIGGMEDGTTKKKNQ